MYAPAEDSYLILRHIRQYAAGSRSILDMGTGSGILAEEAAKYSEFAIGADIDSRLVRELNKKNKAKNLLFVCSDLFSFFDGNYARYNTQNKRFITRPVNRFRNRFDLIIFNPPYLPKDRGIEDMAIYGGKRGYELIEKFLKGAGNYLEADGRILLLFSSITGREKINGFIHGNSLKFREIGRKRIFFEELYVYLISR